jgi:hypothetical protein
MKYRKIYFNEETQSFDEPVNFVGVCTLNWKSNIAPEVGFIEIESTDPTPRKELIAFAEKIFTECETSHNEAGIIKYVDNFLKSRPDSKKINERTAQRDIAVIYENYIKEHGIKSPSSEIDLLHGLYAKIYCNIDPPQVDINTPFFGNSGAKIPQAVYTLNCDKCGDVFCSESAFPTNHLCVKCYAKKHSQAEQPTPMEIIREAFKPIQLGQSNVVNEAMELTDLIKQEEDNRNEN